MKRWDLLNLIAKKIKAETYLEIGVQNVNRNFNKVNVSRKVGVDPELSAIGVHRCKSDVFFSKNKAKFDLIFIDGLHTKEQVKKDFENALDVLNDGGYIVLHDCNPPTEATTCIPRGDQKEWCGDVYKFACSLATYGGIDYITVDTDYGCCIVWKDHSVSIKDRKEITWDLFEKEKSKLLNMVTVEFITEFFK
jgi:hypothetical protein